MNRTDRSKDASINASAGVATPAVEGDLRPLRDLLLAKSGVPGPRPNWRLMDSIAGDFAAAYPRSQQAIDELCAMDYLKAQAGSSYPSLPMVGFLTVGFLLARTEGKPREKLLRKLHEATDDPRFEIRDAAVRSLQRALRANTVSTLDELSSWTSSYLQADAVLRAMGAPDVIERISEAALALPRLSETVQLIEQAPRAHQRAQGYRMVLKSLHDTLLALGKRFAPEVCEWLAQQAGSKSEDVVSLVESSLHSLRNKGMRASDAVDVENALESHKLPPRDPRWDRGPTRSRGNRSKSR